MPMPLTFGAYGFAEASIGAVTGDVGLGFYRLLFSVKLQVHGTAGSQRSAELRDLRLDLALPAPTSLRIGRLSPEPRFLTVRNYPQGSSTEGMLAMDLDAVRLEAIEAARNGGDLMVQVTWQSAVADVDGTIHHSSHDEPFKINQSTWKDVLDRLGYAKLMLLEIPMFDGLGPQLQEASDYLRKARTAMLRREYREAVGCCRDVIESLMRALGDSDVKIARLIANTHDLDKAERLALLRQALKVMTHPARHADEVAASFEWTRDDAMAVIGMTASLMRALVAPGARTLVATIA